MGSAGSDGPTVAFRIVIEHDGDVPTVDEVLEALQGCPNAYYIEVHPAGDPCAEVGHLLGELPPLRVQQTREVRLMVEPLLFAIEEVPSPKGKRKHGPAMGTTLRGENVWQCGNALCGACAAAFHTEVGADLCDFRAPSGERCRYTANHGRPLSPPPEVPTHMCIPTFGLEGGGRR